MNKYLVSTAVLPLCVGKNFYDYTAIAEAYKKLDIDGVEFVFLPEWDSNHAPLTPTPVDWNSVPKVEVRELVDFCIRNELSVPVVHINRDVGNMLSSENKETILEGQKVLDENLSGASKLGSRIAVLHMWDTYSENLDLNKIYKRVYEVTGNYKIQIAVENVPISDKKLTQGKVWELLESIMPSDYGFTLDLNWCSLYNNFDELKRYKDRVLHVHAHGYLAFDGENKYTLSPKVGNLDIISKLSEFCMLGYNGYITLEMVRAKGEEDFKKALEIIKNNTIKE